mgnify:CR=1 FL=1
MRIFKCQHFCKLVLWGIFSGTILSTQNIVIIGEKGKVGKMGLEWFCDLIWGNFGNRKYRKRGLRFGGLLDTWISQDNTSTPVWSSDIPLGFCCLENFTNL